MVWFACIALVLVVSLLLGQLRRSNRALARRNEHMVQAGQMKADFLAMMSHELRTPLNAIIGFSELMHDGRVGPVSAEQREYLGDVLWSARHLRGLIDDVLDVSCVEAGHLALRPESVDLGVLVDDVVRTLHPMATSRSITLTGHVDAELDDVIIDPTRLTQVLYNFLSNALKFARAGGVVAVRVTKVGASEFRLAVIDDGPGLDAEAAEHVWEAFRQGDTPSDRRYGGTGLGLAVTKRLVEAQGGSVSVHSIPGRGATFVAVLPQHPHRSTLVVRALSEVC